jgi:hypothetical protein
LHEDSYQNFIQIHSNIHRIHINIASEKQNIENLFFFFNFGPQAFLFPAAQPAQPAHARLGLASGVRPGSAGTGPWTVQTPRPGRNLGLGRESSTMRARAWALFGPAHRR